MWVAPTCECPFHMWVAPCPFHMWVAPTHECPFHTWVAPTHECPFHMWVAPTCECPLPHVSCMWRAPLHHWGNVTREGHYCANEPHVINVYACEGLPSTIEGMLHVRGITVHISHTWLCPFHTWVAPTHECSFHMWVAPTLECPLHMWAICDGLPSTIEGMLHMRGITVHMSHTWAVREVLPSTIEGMLHMRGITMHISHTWAIREGSPPPLRECYMWGAYRACEPHVTVSLAHVSSSHTWVYLLHMSRSHMWVPLPHMSCTWGAPLHHWGNATCEGHYHACEPHVTHVYAHCSPPPSKKSDQKTIRQPHR